MQKNAPGEIPEPVSYTHCVYINTHIGPEENASEYVDLFLVRIVRDAAVAEESVARGRELSLARARALAAVRRVVVEV